MGYDGVRVSGIGRVVVDNVLAKRAGNIDPPGGHPFGR